MFGSLGWPELLVIAVIALFIFGPRKLPELMRSLGKSMAEFKRASNDLRNTLDEEIRLEEARAERPAPARPSPAPAATLGSDASEAFAVPDPHAPGEPHAHEGATPPHGDPLAGAPDTVPRDRGV